ncbi:hypothetical protein H4R33_006993, partial [Dimargaris cristalligena]
GCGLVNAFNAVTATISFRVRYTLSMQYRDQMGGTYYKSIFYTNRSKGDLLYNFEVLQALSVSGFDKNGVTTTTPRTSEVAASVVMSKTSDITGAGTNGSNDLIFSTAPIRQSDFMIFSGYIRAYPASGYTGVNFTFPFMGLAYQSTTIPVLPPLSTGLPALVNYGVGAPLPTASTTTFSFTGNDFPAVVFRLQHPVRRVRIRIANASTPTSIHGIVSENHYLFLQRHLDSLGQNVYTYRWNGQLYYSDKPTDVFNAPNRDFVLLFYFYSVFQESSPVIYYSPVIRVKRG